MRLLRYESPQRQDSIADPALFRACLKMCQQAAKPQHNVFFIIPHNNILYVGYFCGKILSGKHFIFTGSRTMSKDEFKRLYAHALSIATFAHRGQTDKAERAYIDHPVAVAARCRSDKAKIAALLHDTIEDT